MKQDDLAGPGSSISMAARHQIKCSASSYIIPGSSSLPPTPLLSERFFPVVDVVVASCRTLPEECTYLGWYAGHIKAHTTGATRRLRRLRRGQPPRMTLQSRRGKWAPAFPERQWQQCLALGCCLQWLDPCLVPKMFFFFHFCLSVNIVLNFNLRACKGPRLFPRGGSV